MLIAKIFENNKQIDEIHIQNVGASSLAGMTEYRIRNPAVKNDVLHHDRKSGYYNLLANALTNIFKQGAPRGVIRWQRIVRADGRIEYECEHGVGHGGVHGCDGCCSRSDFPLKSRL